MQAEKFDQQFEGDVDITKSLDFPTWMIKSLDHEAKKLGVTRQSVIKVWLTERLPMQGV